MKVAPAVWRFNGSLLTVPPTEQQDYSEYKVDTVSRETSGNYECSISNDVGVAVCKFQVSGKSCKENMTCFSYVVDTGMIRLG